MGSSLKLLHCLLLKLSPNESVQQNILGDGVSMLVSNHWFITKVKYTDIIRLANSLYEELHKHFSQIFLGTSHLPLVVVPNQKGSLLLDTEASSEKFILLLRCSMIILQFLEFDLTIMLEKCQILVAVLKDFCPPKSLLDLPRCSLHPDDVLIPYSGSSVDFFSSVLEVFIDELLVKPELRKHFAIADCVSTTNEKLFVSRTCHGDIHVILELISSHFLISVRDELSFKRFICSLSWSSEVGSGIPVLGLDPALTLLGLPIMFSAPQLLQAHLIILASRCIGIHLPADDMIGIHLPADDRIAIHLPADDRKSELLKMNRYILAFELSVNLFVGYMPAINYADNIIGGKCEPNSCDKEISFDFHVCSMTYNKLNHQSDKFIDFCHMQTNGLFSGTTDDIMKDSITYIKANQHFIDETFRDKTCLILKHIIKVILSWEKQASHEDEEGIQQGLFCVAAALKLMSSSLLQIIWLLRKDGTSGEVKTLKCYLVCKEYDFILGITRCFQNYSGNCRLQKLIFDVMGTNARRNKETVLMFSHFASLLLYSHRKKIDFLWKGCIFMLMSVVNLFILEDGNLDAFGQFLHDLERPTCLHSSQDLVHRHSSAKIASNLKRAREEMQYQKYENHWMGNGAIPDTELQDCVSDALRTKDKEKQNTYTLGSITCNGRNFLECFPGYHDNNKEWEDLVDFIDCKPGKDYSSWLKKRERFRKWKHKRMAVREHKLKREKLRKVQSGIIMKRWLRFRKERKICQQS